MKSGLINKMVTLIAPFLLRTIVIKYLGTEFAGLGSLFTSILQVLNLAELGVGSAITFSLYKPVTEKDADVIRATMNLYKKIYKVIGVIVLIVGLIIMPNLHIFISGDVPENINIYILYSLYLLNTILSYLLFAYKRVLLEVHQRNDIVSNINTVLSILQFVLQAVAVLVFKNYYLFVAGMLVGTILNNIIGAYYAKKKYPEYYSAGKLSKERKKEIRKKVYGLMIQKVCAVSRNSMDSIFISAFLGLNLVAIYNNYYMILTAVISILSVLTMAMNASVGNSIATETEKKNYDDMNKINFIYMWISGWCAVCLLCLFQPFMKVWLGNDLLLPNISVVLLAIYFYALKVGDVRSMYVEGAGLFWEVRYRALFEAILNIALNAILGALMGINGIILATIISIVLINIGYGSSIVFKYYFKHEKVSHYFKTHFMYFGVTCIIAAATYLLLSFINIDNLYIDLIVKGIICLILPNLFYLAFYYKYPLIKDVKTFIDKVKVNR